MWVIILVKWNMAILSVAHLNSAYQWSCLCKNYNLSPEKQSIKGKCTTYTIAFGSPNHQFSSLLKENVPSTLLTKVQVSKQSSQTVVLCVINKIQQYKLYFLTGLSQIERLNGSNHTPQWKWHNHIYLYQEIEKNYHPEERHNIHSTSIK